MWRGNLARWEFWRFGASRESARRVEPLLARYDEQLVKQQNLVNRLRFLSPAIVTQEAMNDLAETGAARYHHFNAQAGRFHDQHRAYFRPKAFALVPLKSSDYDAMPRFEWREEASSAVAGRLLPDVLALGLGAFALLGLGLARARRGEIAG